MEVSHMRKLAIDVFKTLNSLNPDFTDIYLTMGSDSDRRLIGLVANSAKTTMLDKKNLRTLETKIWNYLSEDVKDLITHSKFTYFITSGIRQKGESQNGCFKKAKHAKISEKQTFLTP